MTPSGDSGVLWLKCKTPWADVWVCMYVPFVKDTGRVILGEGGFMRAVILFLCISDCVPCVLNVDVKSVSLCVHKHDNSPRFSLLMSTIWQSVFPIPSIHCTPTPNMLSDEIIEWDSAIMSTVHMQTLSLIIMKLGDGSWVPCEPLMGLMIWKWDDTCNGPSQWKRFISPTL